MPRMRTTVTIDSPVERELRAYAGRHGTNFKKALNDLLRKGLLAAEKEGATRPYATKPKKVGLKPGLSYDNVSELLERVEGADYR